MKRTIIQHLRSFVIDLASRAGNWVCDHIVTDSDETTWVDYLRWWLEGLISTVFGWAWHGSDEELEAVYHSEVPLYAMSDRQRAALTGSPVFRGVHCVHCRFDGYLSDCEGDYCPECRHGVYADAFDAPETEELY